MPLLETKGAASAQGFGLTLGGAERVFIEDVFSTFLYTGNGSTQTITNGIPLGSTAEFWGVKFRENSSVGYGITTDSSGNVYVTGYASDGVNSYAFIAKYNTSGTLQWQRKFREGSSVGSGIATDSSGNVYVTGSANDGGNSYAFIAKYNTSGTLQWQRKFRESVSFSVGYGISTDSSGNVYVIGYAFDGSLYAFIVKYNTSGTLQWQRKFREGVSEGNGIATDSSGNVYVIGRANDGNPYAFIAKYNTSGTLQWQRKFRESGSEGYGIATDSSGNVYVIGYANDGSDYAFIAKYNTSGTLQWQRKFREGVSEGNGIATDSSGNVYVIGYAFDGSLYAFIAKYNTSGTLQWQRKFRQNSSVGSGIATDSSGNVYVTGSANDGSQYAFILELAQDGSTTSGTVNNGTLTNGTATDSAGTATDSSGTATDSSGTATDSAGTATDSAGTATSTTQTQVAVEGKGGLTILKGRSGATNWAVYDTARGATFDLATNTTAAQTTQSTGLTAFNSNGFSIGALAKINTNAATYASWTFRKQPKFFDVVTYTGDGTSDRVLNHALGSAPGAIFIKCTSNADDWWVTHRSVGTDTGDNSGLRLNTTDASANYGIRASTNSSTTFTLKGSNNVTYANTSGRTYVAYLFAHDAGGFGLNGTDNVISCGSYTGNGSSTGPTVTLNYEPQWLMVKNSSGTGNWNIIDNMRGMPVGSADAYLEANTADAEASAEWVSPTATGFQITSTSSEVNTNASTYIYIAIRRGPMRVPTSGTSVYNAIARAGTSSPTVITGAGFAPDLLLAKARNSGEQQVVYDRLRGGNLELNTSATSAEASFNNDVFNLTMDGASIGTGSGGQINSSFATYINWFFRRAPGFFDVVCYTGTGAATTFSHNLGAVPELMIVKRRDTTADWWAYDAATGNTKYQVLNSTATPTTSSTAWNNTTPTSSVFSVGTGTPVNASAGTYVAYLFATVAGVSKVGSYTGTGSTLQINCGFTGGARFVLIKRTDSSGDWYVWDTARGIVAGNDPYLALNSTAAEVTTTDWVDTFSSGFELSNVGGNNVNINTATYIYLAIA